MNSLSEYMDRIRAEEALKAKTAAYVRSALWSAQHNDSRRTRPVARRLLTAAASFAVLALLFLGGFAYYNTPTSYICVDINPSVELGVNAFSRVVSTHAYNDDGIRLLTQDYRNMTPEEAVSILVQEAAAQGYIYEDGSTVVAITAESGNESTGSGYRAGCEEAASTALEELQLSAVVYADFTGTALREEAQEAGISPGKLRLIRILQSLDPDATIEQYRDMRITDILLKINELTAATDADWQAGEYAGALERIRAAAQAAASPGGNGQAEQESEQNCSQGPNTDPGTGEQEQNQNTNSTGGNSQQQGSQNSGSGSGQESQSTNSGSGAGEQSQGSGSGSGSGSGQQSQVTDSGSGSGSDSGSGPGSGAGQSNSNGNSQGDDESEGSTQSHGNN